MEYAHIRVSQQPEGTDVRPQVIRIELSRPPLNVINMAMMQEIASALEAAKDEPQLRAVVFSGAGKAFSAGVDVGEHMGETVNQMLAAFHRIFYLLEELEIPTVAAVRGAALGGGCELATFCDLIIAGESATFGVPEIKLAVYPPVAAACWPSQVGYHRAMELLLTGDTIDAWEAFRIGLANKVVADSELEQEVDRFVARLTPKSGAALRIVKRVARHGGEQGLAGALGRAEDIYLRDLMATEDATEGIVSFMEKRKPLWRDR